MAATSTIAALSSGLLPSGVAVIRVSGPRVRFALEMLCGSVPPPRRAVLRSLRDPKDGHVLDQALVLFFASPSSFTGEDVAEFHCHGGRAVVDGVISALLNLDGIGLAEAGDFTRQAFSNGKLDLIQVEALGDLIHASTSLQRSLALSQMSGAASARVMSWRQTLLEARASIEADLDFSDEDDVPGSVIDSLPQQLSDLLSEIRDDLDDRFSERLRDGFHVVLAGAPNSGKSTLLNALLNREAALVSPIAGTTRDQIDVAIDMDGLPVILSDTAGLRDSAATQDELERLGMVRTHKALEDADCVVWLEGGDVDDMSIIQASGGEQNTGKKWIRIRSKSDLEDAKSTNFDPVSEQLLLVSGQTGAGLDTLKERIAARLRKGYDGRSLKDPIALDARRRSAIERCEDALQRALVGFEEAQPALDHIAEELRIAQRALGAVTGDADVEEVLDVVFHRFCIGK